MRARGKCTVNELAEAAAVSPVSVRHHLTNLQAENLVQAEEVRHGVGRPRLLFSLTDSGHDIFPGRYFRFTNRLLDEIKESMPEEKVQQLFSDVAETMAQQYARILDGLPLEQRLDRMVELLSEEGFDAELENRGQQAVIRELSCPYFRIGRQHREVCNVDERFIATALSLPVERVSCVLDGDAHCTFAISMETAPKEVPAHE